MYRKEDLFLIIPDKAVRVRLPNIFVPKNT